MSFIAPTSSRCSICLLCSKIDSLVRDNKNTLFIKNDRVPLSAIICFTGKPDLRIVNYQSLSAIIEINGAQEHKTKELIALLIHPEKARYVMNFLL